MANTMRRPAAWPFPVKDFTGDVRVAIGISGAVWRLSLQALEEKSRLVRDAADRMSAKFGFAGFAPKERAPADQAARRVKRPRALRFSVDSGPSRLYYFHAEKACRHVADVAVGGSGSRAAEFDLVDEHPEGRR